jgi:DNA invertase Pin-like site-specific DNA recombinase
MAENAGIWIRVSSGKQDEANQLPDVTGYCDTHGYIIAKKYTLHSKSAFHGKQQPTLDKVIADIKAGTITVLVIWHSDRLERREGKALLDVLAEIAAAGGRVESVQEPTLGKLDFGGQEGWLPGRPLPVRLHAGRREVRAAPGAY